MRCTMGTACAPSYTDLFITQFEENIYTIKDMSLLYLRCIDNIFIKWKRAKNNQKHLLTGWIKNIKSLNFNTNVNRRKSHS